MSSSDVEDDSSELLSLIMNESYTMLEPKPQLIIEFQPGENGGRKMLKLNKNTLEKIMNPQNNTRPISILSIVGATHQGKSFFLNYILRYLHAIQRQQSDSLPNIGEDWMELGLIEGFQYGDNQETRTQGIWMWSKPLTLTKQNGQQFDLFLMDTQGVFDECLDQIDESTIVGLGLLLSSTIVFNLNHNLNEKNLEIFASFLAYGVLALSNQDMSKSQPQPCPPFQNLTFLIRDWGAPGQFSYGFDGGQKFLVNKLLVKENQSEVQKKVREQLDQCFDSMKCCLLPHPGEIVLQSNSYNDGFPIINLEPRFKLQLKNCIAHLMNPESLALLKIQENLIIPATFITALQLYIDIFNGDKLPEPVSLFQVHIKIFNSSIVNSSFNLYKNEMARLLKLGDHKFLFDEPLKQLDKECRDMALGGFSQMKKMGNEKEAQFSRERLEAAIEAHSTIVTLINLEVRHRQLSKGHQRALLYLEGQMSNALANIEYFDDAPFDSMAEREMQNAVDLFHEDCPLVSPRCSEMESELKKLWHDLELKRCFYKEKNTLKRTQAQMILEQAQLAKISFTGSILEQYNSTMTNQMAGIYLLDQDLQKIHDHALCQVFTEAHQSNPQLLRETRENTEEKIQPLFQLFQSHNILCRQRMDKVGKKIVVEAIKIFETNMAQCLDYNDLDFEKSLNETQMNCDGHLITKFKLDQSGELKKILLQRLKLKIESLKAKFRTERANRKFKKGAMIVGGVVGGIAVGVGGSLAAPVLVPAAAGAAVAGWVAPAIIIGEVAAQAAVGAAAGLGAGGALGVGVGAGVGALAKNKPNKGNAGGDRDLNFD